MTEALWQSELPGLAPPRRGKVRDVFDLGDVLLIVASDRLSAYDHVLRPGIPGKGKILNQLSNFWFGPPRGGGAEPPPGDPSPRTSPPSWRRSGRSCGAARCWARKAPGGPLRVAWPGGISRAAASASTKKRAPSVAFPLPAGLQRASRPAGAPLHPGDQGRSGARRERGLRHRRTGRGRRARRHPARSDPEALQPRSRPRRRPEPPPGRHQARVRPTRSTPASCS